MSNVVTQELWQTRKADILAALPAGATNPQKWDAESKHWAAIRERLDAGGEVPPEVLGDYAVWYAKWYVRREVPQTPPEIPQSVTVRSGRKTVTLSLPARSPSGVKEVAPGKYQLCRGQLSGGGFVDYQPGTIIRGGFLPDSPWLVVTKAERPTVSRHDGSITGYWQTVTARPLTEAEAAGHEQLQAGREARELWFRLVSGEACWADIQDAKAKIQEYRDTLARAVAAV